VLFTVLGLPGLARADERADAIADALRRSGLYITDSAVREISAADAPALRALLARVPGRTFLAVTPALGVQGTPLLALLHDRVGADGVYILMEPDGYLFAQEFGPGGLPVADAVRATDNGLAYDAGPVAFLRRFVGVVTSGPARAAAAAEKVRHSDPGTHEDRRNQVDNWVQVGSSVAGAAWVVFALRWRRRRRARRGPEPGLAGGVGA
jgi:hypothetical protein